VSPCPFPPGSEFVSPSRTISSEGFKELKRSVDEREGQEVSTHELRYVHTVCTVIEERFISSEMVEAGTVVPGSEKYWPVSEGRVWHGGRGGAWFQIWVCVCV